MGKNLFDYLDHHADLDALFSEAMDSVEALTGDSFATDFDWGRYERIIDVGGSRGAKSLAILKRHPKLTALVVDRPQVIEEAKKYWAARSATGIERLRFQAGDALTSIPWRKAIRISTCSPPCCMASMTKPALPFCVTLPRHPVRREHGSLSWKWSFRSVVLMSQVHRSICRCSWVRVGASAH